MNTSRSNTASRVAKYFIWKANKDGKELTNKRLQKLLYYAQAWNLTIKDKPLFKDDIEAWIHGPAVRVVYHEYKKYGYDPIKEKIDTKEINDLIDDSLLDEVWKVYGKYDAEYLEELTHNEYPWQKAREGLNSAVASSNIITHDSMRNYYRKRLEDAKS